MSNFKKEFLKKLSIGILIPIFLGAWGSLWGIFTNIADSKIDHRINKKITTYKKDTDNKIKQIKQANKEDFNRVNDKLDKLMFHLIPTK